MNARVLPNEDASAIQRWHAARNVLAVRLDNMGDVLMTTPALSAIRHTLPQARLTLLGSPAGAAVARHISAIDDLMLFEAPWMKSAVIETVVHCRGAQRMIKRLASRRFDAAIVFTGCTESALPAAMLCMLADIPLRLAHSRENPYALLTDWAPESDTIADGMRHEVARQLALVAKVRFYAPNERLQFRVSVEDALQLQQRMESVGFDPKTPYFVVHPGASAPSRRYPAGRFGEAARLLAEGSGCQAIFTGTPVELALVAEARVAMGIPSVSFAGELTLGELGALIAGARVLLANNSVPAHIAAAVNTPVVDLYARTHPQHTPWQVPSRVLYADVPCRNCLRSVCSEGHHACLLGVSPQRVAQEALELMGIETDSKTNDQAFEVGPIVESKPNVGLTEAG